MTKPRSILWPAILFAAILGAFTWQVLRPHEPVYAGKPLSFWLKQYIIHSRDASHGRDQERLRAEAESAIRGIGPDALPVFLKMAAEKDSLVKKKMIQLLPQPTAYSLHLWDGHDHHWMAGYGLQALGPAAKAAVPALITQLDDRDLELRASALVVLGDLGPLARDAAPAVMKCLTDPDLGLRCCASNTLKQIDPATAAKLGTREITLPR